MNDLPEHPNILSFKVIFLCWKLIKSFNFIFFEIYWTRRPTFDKKCFWKYWFLEDTTLFFINIKFLGRIYLILITQPFSVNNFNILYYLKNMHSAVGWNYFWRSKHFSVACQTVKHHLMVEFRTKLPPIGRILNYSATY